MRIKNVQIYGLEESIIRSGYPMQIGEPGCIDGVFDKDRTDLSNYLYGNDAMPKNVIRAKKLAKVQNGSGHDNYLKGIIVQFDLYYPQYLSPQLQRYHWIDIVSSQSKMHKLTSIKNIKNSCNKYVLPRFYEEINNLIKIYNSSTFPLQLSTPKIINIESKEEFFQYIVSNLPMGFELWMGISTNYLQLKTIYSQRKNHKLYDWKEFCQWIESLPMSDLIINKK